jgi:hypothetical protein
VELPTRKIVSQPGSDVVGDKMPRHEIWKFAVLFNATHDHSIGSVVWNLVEAGVGDGNRDLEIVRIAVGIMLNDMSAAFYTYPTLFTA